MYSPPFTMPIRLGAAAVLLLATTFHPGTLFAQQAMHGRVQHMLQNGERPAPVALFGTAGDGLHLAEAMRTTQLPAEAVLFEPMEKEVTDLLLRAAPFIEIELPIGSTFKNALLYGFDPTLGELAVHGAPEVDLTQVRFYRGAIAQEPGSWVALTVMPGEVRGMLSTGGALYTWGRSPLGPHLLYRADGFDPGVSFSCDALLHPESAPDEPHFVAAPKSNRCVKVRAEVEKNLIDFLGGTQNATNYTLGLFNEVTTLYANDNINLALAEIQLWPDGSPYSGTAIDYIIQMTNNSPNANLTAMLSRANFGGVAYLSSVCSVNFGVSYNGVFGSFNSVPSYSWDVMVVAHELGHNLSSQHTHACAWNGNNTAIDGCGPQAGYSEGCSASLPANGGTIMSYCHLISGVGIQFANGFGVQPANRIRNYVNNASCLSPTCGGITQEPEPPNCTPINFNQVALSVYAPSQSIGSSSIQDSGNTLFIQNNTGRSVQLGYPIGPNTILQFDFRSTSQAQVHGIGFHSNSNLVPSRIFKIYGTLNNTQIINNFSTYAPSSWTTYSIPVGSFYTGENLSQLFFLTGNVNGVAGGNSSYRNVRVFESGQCAPLPSPFGESPTLKIGDAAAATTGVLYPNPATDRVHIWLQGVSDRAQLRMYDLSGKVVLETLVQTGVSEISAAGIPVGLYITELRVGQQVLWRDKLVVVR